jgi:hypothetical protein
VALDHYVPQVHIRNFYSHELGRRMYALRKSDLRAFTCRSEDVCRIEAGSTNTYLKEPRIIENFLTEVEPYYNTSVANLRSDTIDHRTVFAIGGFIAYVQTSSPAGMRIFSEPLRKSLETIAEVEDAKGSIPLSPAQLGGKSLTKLIAEGAIKFTVDPKYPQALGVTTIMGRLSKLGNSRWEILLNDHPTSPFFTSDYPLAIEPAYDPRIVHWIIPLAPDIAVRIIPDLRLARSKDDLTFSKFSYNVRRLRHAEVRKLNQRIVQCAEDNVFYRNDEKWVANFIAKNRHYRIETNTRKIRISTGIRNLPALSIAPHRYATDT